jgi:hemerythrin
MLMWEENMVLGIDIIDKQHKSLVEQMEFLSDALASDKPLQKYEETLQFLDEYTVQHFRDEEQLMVEAGYVGYKRHKALHQDFIVELENMKETLLNGESPRSAAYVIFKVLLAWLVQHIMREDKKMADFVKLV